MAQTKITSLEQCYKRLNGNDILITKKWEISNDKLIRKINDLLEYKNDMVTKVEKFLDEAITECGSSNLIVGDYNMDAIIAVLKEELDVLSKDYDTAIEFLIKNELNQYEQLKESSYNNYQEYLNYQNIQKGLNAAKKGAGRDE